MASGEPSETAVAQAKPRQRKAMAWKIGLGLFLVGVLLVVAGPVSLGTAAVSAAQKREVAVERLSPGEQMIFEAIEVDPAQNMRLRITATTRVSDAVIDTQRQAARSDIRQFRIPVTYKVTDPAGETVHNGAGYLTGSKIVPDGGSPHFAGFDPEVECNKRSDKFAPPRGGEVNVIVEVDSEADSGEAVDSASVIVIDQLSSGAAVWGMGGCMFLIFGPLLTLVGYTTFGAGLLSVRTRIAQDRGEAGLEAVQLIALIGGLLAILGMLVGLIPLLGWLNWFVVPLSAAGVIYGIIALATSQRSDKVDALIGLMLCVIATCLAMVRLVIGFGII